MSEPKRYFKNTLQPFVPGDTVTIAEADLKTLILRYVSIIQENYPSSVADGDGGLYVGAAGVAHMFHYLSQASVMSEHKNELQRLAIQYIEVALNYVAEERKKHIPEPCQRSGFLLGHAGIFAMATVIHHAAGHWDMSDLYSRHYAESAEPCKEINFLPCGGDELFVGRAGYLIGLQWVQKALNRPLLFHQDIYRICDAIVISGRDYARRHKSACPLMYAYYETEYLGAAHGLSSILQALLCVPGYLSSNADIEHIVRRAVDYILSLQTPSGNFPCATDEIGQCARRTEDELVHWCHGAPGVIYLMAKAYMFWKDEKYLQSCIKAGELVWEKGLLRKGPGLCHGIAGNGYVFLLLFRMTGQQKYLHQAQEFARFLESDQFTHHASTPDSPYSLHEGLAGTCCFLVDLTQPQKAAFPHFDVL